MGVWLEVPNFSINCLVILIHLHFAHASMIIKVDNKVINSLNRIYLNLILYSTFYLVNKSGIITYLVNPETVHIIVLLHL